MNRKLTLSILGAACLALTVGAKSRSAAEALEIARTFYEGQSLLRAVAEQ